MRKLLLFVSFLWVSAVVAYGQTATTISNGSWMMPTTWDCSCVPTTGYTVNIMHDVTLSSNWGFVAGSINVLSDGTLVGTGGNWALSISGSAALNVDGVLTVSVLAVTGGSISNDGVIENIDSLFLGVNLDNNGIIKADNLLNTATLNNDSLIEGVNYFNNGVFSNAGTLNMTNFFNNNQTLNSGSLVFDNCTNAASMLNNGDFFGNMDFTNAGTFTNEASVTILNNFANVDSTNHDALLINNNSVLVFNSFSNADSVKGDGNFCVGFYTANYGVFDGSFEFCDNTPPGSAPFIDINTGGTIGPGITWCSGPCISNINNPIVPEFIVYPVPAKDFIFVKASDPICYCSISDLTGKTLLEINTFDQNEFSIDVSDFEQGLYLISVKSQQSHSVSVIAIE